jgi:hypothetical protein
MMRSRLFGTFVLFAFLIGFMGRLNPVYARQTSNPNPPEQPVRLIFVHHSTGGNWLADPAGNELGGDLGRVLMENNYFVSATNYGWGPDAIGDRTDIPDWPEWFRSENSATYLKALYNETGQNFGDFGAWPRLSTNPGGENQVIVFKSCFPNSDLEGRPDDPPDPEGWLSVGHAKFVYNDLLTYFATRPDKLFVVITAPPLSDRTRAANARAFNNWLVNDWLRENNYPLNNVAVFDFYNVLTAPENHHRYTSGQIEHVLASNRNTLYYPSSPGDDHPSHAGNRKATEEFVPMLNVFYNRWKASAPAQPPAAETTQPEPTSANAPAPAPPSEGFSADFESAFDWEVFDDGGGTKIQCGAVAEQAHGGAQAMQVAYSVAANGWATCGKYFDPQDWSAANGITFYLRTLEPNQTLHVDLYAAGQEEQNETYVYTLQTSAENTKDWVAYQLRWDDFKRVDWEENAGASFSHPGQVTGLAFGIPSLSEKTVAGTFWIDDLQLLGTGASPAPEVTPAPEAAVPTEQPAKPTGSLPFCGGALFPLILLGGLVLSRRKTG